MEELKAIESAYVLGLVDEEIAEEGIISFYKEKRTALRRKRSEEQERKVHDGLKQLVAERLSEEDNWPLKTKNSRVMKHDDDGKVATNTFTTEDNTEFKKRIEPELKKVLLAVKNLVAEYNKVHGDNCEFLYHVPKNGIDKYLDLDKNKFTVVCYPCGFEGWTKEDNGCTYDFIADLGKITSTKFKIEIMECKNNTDHPYYIHERWYQGLLITEK